MSELLLNPKDNLQLEAKGGGGAVPKFRYFSYWTGVREGALPSISASNPPVSAYLHLYVLALKKEQKIRP